MRLWLHGEWLGLGRTYVIRRLHRGLDKCLAWSHTKGGGGADWFFAIREREGSGAAILPTNNSVLQAVKPPAYNLGIFSGKEFIKIVKVALSAARQLNDVCHICAATFERLREQDGSGRGQCHRGLAELLQRRRTARQCPAGADRTPRPERRPLPC